VNNVRDLPTLQRVFKVCEQQYVVYIGLLFNYLTAARIQSVSEPSFAATVAKLEFGMYPQSMPTEWTHARTLRPWQSVRLDL